MPTPLSLSVRKHTLALAPFPQLLVCAFFLSLNFISLQIMRFAEVFNLQLGFHVKLFSIAASICYFFVLSLICLILRILSGWSHDVDKFKYPFLSSSSQHCNFNEFQFVIK